MKVGGGGGGIEVGREDQWERRWRGKRKDSEG